MRLRILFILYALAVPLANPDALRAQTAPTERADVAKLISDLERGNVAARWYAAYRLGQLGDTAKPAADSLLKALADDDFRVVWYSIYALGNVGEGAADAVSALREALSGEKDSTSAKYVAAKALGDKYTRRFAAQALGRIGPAAKSAVPELRQAIASSDASLRVAAALALWHVAADGAAIDVLSKMLSADDVNAAHEAALAFTQIGSAGRPGIDALVRALNSDTEDVRRSAARALGQLGPVALPALTQALSSTNVDVRRAAAQGLGWLGNTVTDKVLYSDTIALGTFKKVYGQLNSTAVAALRVALADQDADVRRLAAEAIGSIGPIAIPTLVAAIQESSSTLRASAALAMERVEARSTLTEINSEFADAFRKSGAESLIVGIRSTDPFVRLQAVRMFASLGMAQVAPGARPQLIRLLKDDNVQVRRFAASALRQIRQPQQQEINNLSEDKP